MNLERTLIWSSSATKHLLEARLHLLAAIEAMADMEGLIAEYQKAIHVRDGLDEVLMAVEDRTAEILNQLKQSDHPPQADGQ